VGVPSVLFKSNIVLDTIEPSQHPEKSATYVVYVALDGVGVGVGVLVGVLVGVAD
jgi:hypothetical protein